MKTLHFWPKEQTWLDAPDWFLEAACRGMDQNLFFNDADHSGERGHKVPEDHLYGLEVCKTCPVVLPCLEQAVKDPSLDFGIRGGMTTNKRRKERRRRRGLSAVSSMRSERRP